MTDRSGNIVEIGSAVTGLGGTFAAGFWIYARATAGVSVWDWQLWAALAAIGLGLILIAVGRTSQGEESSQIQRGGRGSRNYQAGRDMTIGNEGENG